jgi:hypothetical protein
MFAAMSRLSWNLVDESNVGQASSGQSLDLTIADPDGGFRRAELTVTDEKLHGSYLHVIFEAREP